MLLCVVTCPPYAAVLAEQLPTTTQENAFALMKDVSHVKVAAAQPTDVRGLTHKPHRFSEAGYIHKTQWPAAAAVAAVVVATTTISPMSTVTCIKGNEAWTNGRWSK